MFTRTSSRTLLVGGALALLLSGCHSLDSTPDVLSAGDLVAERSGARPPWQENAALDTPLPASLSLGDAIERALRVHPTLRRDLARVARARADLVANDRLPNPRLTFGVGTVIDGGGGSPLRGGLLAPLTALFTRPARVAAAEAGLRAEIFQLAADALHTIEEVTVAYAEVVHGRERVTLDTRATALLAERLALIDTVVAAGEASRATSDSARVELAKAHERLSQSRTALAVAERQLLEQLGAIDRMAPCPGLLPDSLPTLTQDTFSLPDEHDLIGMVALRRLDVAAAVARAERAGAQLRVASRARFGEIGATVGLERNFTGREAITTGLSLEIPIFDLGGADVARADAERAIEVHEAETALWHAYLEARTNHARVVGAKNRLAILAEQWLPAAHGRAELLKATAEAGEASRSEALLAASLAVAADRVFNEAALEATRALGSLIRSAGGTLSPLSVEESDRLTPLPAPAPDERLTARGTS